MGNEVKIETVYTELKKMQKDAFESLMEFIREQEPKGFITSGIYEGNVVSFKMGPYSVELRGEVKPFAQAIFFTTTINSKHLNKLDLLYKINLEIIAPKQKNEAIVSDNFGNQYCAGVFKLIRASENEQLEWFKLDN